MKKSAKYILKDVLRNYQLYLFMLPALLYLLVFKYIPMYGAQIAFKEFVPSMGIGGSKWIGFTHFRRFFASSEFWTVLRNTLSLSVMQLAVCFPMPIVIALMINQSIWKRFKKAVQTAIYAPHFISTVVLAGMVYVFVAPSNGLFNLIIKKLGGEGIFFMGEAGWFKPLYVLSSLWQNSGWDAIIYIGALTSISPELYETAEIDGANKLQKILHIDLPSILPTIIILLILNVGNIMSMGFEKAYLMQNNLNRASSEIISTYVYKMMISSGGMYSFSAAVGLFNSVINLVLLISSNQLAKRFGDTSLW